MDTIPWNTLGWKLQRYPCACGFDSWRCKIPTALVSKLIWVVHTDRKANEHGLGRPHPDEQGKPEHPMALCTSYPSIRTWMITRAQTGLSPHADYLYKLWDKVAFKYGYQPKHHTCVNKHHSSLAQGQPCLSRDLVLERPIKEDETEPWNKN